MKRRRSFLPSVRDSALEDRLVLSQSPVPSSIVDAYIRQFRSLLDSISTGITNDVNSTLLGSSNSTPTSASRTAYDGAIQDLIAGANVSLDNILSLSPLAQKKFTGQVDDLLSGTGSTSLQSELNALTTPTASGTPVTTFTTDSTNLVSATLAQALADLDAFFSADNPLRRQIGSASMLAISVQRSYSDQFVSEFTTFQTNYTSDVTGTLLAGTDAAAIPANRAAFDSQVQADAAVLASDLTDMLALFPGLTKAQGASIEQRLISGTNSMLDQLNALASPTDLNGTSARSFQTQSTAIITAAQTDVLKTIGGTFASL